MNAPERIYLDGDVEVGDGVFPRCFENPKYASEPPVEYIRADLVGPLSDPRVKALVESVQIDAIRAALEAAAAIAEDAESGRCQRCGHPRNNHPYRHPFIGFASGDLPAAIRALDPAAIVAKLKGDGDD